MTTNLNLDLVQVFGWLRCWREVMLPGAGSGDAGRRDALDT